MPMKDIHHIDLRITKELWQEIKTKAKDENRSINAQIITLLQIAMLEGKKNTSENAP